MNTEERVGKSSLPGSCWRNLLVVRHEIWNHQKEWARVMSSLTKNPELAADHLNYLETGTATIATVVAAATAATLQRI